MKCVLLILIFLNIVFINIGVQAVKECSKFTYCIDNSNWGICNLDFEMPCDSGSVCVENEEGTIPCVPISSTTEADVKKDSTTESLPSTSKSETTAEPSTSTSPTTEPRKSTEITTSPINSSPTTVPSTIEEITSSSSNPTTPKSETSSEPKSTNISPRTTQSPKSTEITTLSIYSSTKIEPSTREELNSSTPADTDDNTGFSNDIWFTTTNPPVTTTKSLPFFCITKSSFAYFHSPNVVEKCPNGFYCSPNAASPCFLEPTTTSKPSSGCSASNVGLYPYYGKHGLDCRSYLNCKNYKGKYVYFLEQCPKGTGFSLTLLKCSSNVNCYM